MIDDDELTRLMERLADAYEPPVNGRAAILDAAGDDRTAVAQSVGRRGRRPHRLLPAAAVVAVLAGAVAVVSGLGPSQVDTVASKSAGGRTANEVGGRASTTPSTPIAGAGGAAMAGDDLSPATTIVTSDPSRTTAAGPANALAGARVVKTATVEVEVSRGRFGMALERLTSLAVGRGGFVARTETSEGDAAPSGTVILRVPTGGFDGVIAEVRRLGKVLSATTSGQDVSGQYRDVEARLRGLTASRDQILTVLSKADTVGDILAVQERLNTVQVQIEQLQGQQELLDDQTTLGTVAVRLSEPGGARLGTPTDRSGLAGAWDDARRGFVGGLEALVAGSGTALIVGLALAAMALAGRGAWLLARRRLV